MPKSSTLITADELKEIEQLSALFFTPKEICLIMELSPVDFFNEMDDDSSAIFRAYFAGWYKSEAELRTSVKRLSNSGSSPAQTMLTDIMKHAKAKRSDR